MRTSTPSLHYVFRCFLCVHVHTHEEHTVFLLPCAFVVCLIGLGPKCRDEEVSVSMWEEIALCISSFLKIYIVVFIIISLFLFCLVLITDKHFYYLFTYLFIYKFYLFSFYLIIFPIPLGVGEVR